MQLSINEDKFDELQSLFIRDVIEKVRVKLDEAGIKGLEMEDIAGAIAFSLASAIDDTANIEIDGVDVHPYLTFRDENDNLIHSGDNSYVYEFVRPALKKIFDV